MENASKKRHEDNSEFAVALKKRFASILPTEEEDVEELGDDDGWDDATNQASKPSDEVEVEEDDEDEEGDEGTSTPGDSRSSAAGLDEEDGDLDELEIAEEDPDELRSEITDGDTVDAEDYDDEEYDDGDLEDDDDYFYDDFHL